MALFMFLNSWYISALRSHPPWRHRFRQGHPVKESQKSWSRRGEETTRAISTEQKWVGVCVLTTSEVIFLLTQEPCKEWRQTFLETLYHNVPCNSASLNQIEYLVIKHSELRSHCIPRGDSWYVSTKNYYKRLLNWKPNRSCFNLDEKVFPFFDSEFNGHDKWWTEAKNDLQSGGSYSKTTTEGWVITNYLITSRARALL